jgi:hypothetical protein
MEKDAVNRYYTTSDSFIVVLDSRNYTQKLNGSFNSSITFDFQDTIRDKSNLFKMKASVLTFSAPNSIYTINESNSLLSITILNVTTNYFIPFGNYNSKSFSSAILVILPVGFNISLNSINNKLTVSYTTDFTINGTSTCKDIMGFDNTITSTNNSIILPFTCNFNGLANLNISIPNLSTNNYNSFTKSTSSIIQSVPIQTGIGQIIYYKTNNYSFDITQDGIDYLQIDIQDDLGNYINFNSKNWNLTLCFENLTEVDKYELKHNDFFNVLKNGYFNY